MTLLTFGNLHYVYVLIMVGMALTEKYKACFLKTSEP